MAIEFDRPDGRWLLRSTSVPRRLAWLFLSVLAGACSGGAGEGLPKSGYRTLILHDALSDPLRSPLGELKKFRQRHGIVWIAPRIVQSVVDGPLRLGERMPAATLMQVELVIYPNISCADEGEGHRKLFSDGMEGADGNPAPIDPSVLARLGQPLETRRIWIVPADILGSEFITEDPESIRYTFGPAWFGNFMRVAGHGETTLFPAAQDCREMTESQATSLPARVFGGYSSSDIDPVRISARSPFTARVIERCPVIARQWVEAGVEYQFPLKLRGKPSWTTPRIRHTGEVIGHCSAGERKFTFGPVSIAGTPTRPTLTSTP